MEHEEYTAENYPSFGKKYNGEKAIISLTSWKARINTVSKTLFSLIKQCPGFHIVLVLSEEEFPKMMDELPENLKLFVDNELIEVLWVYKNYKSFKKWIFTQDKYPDVPIISADDGCIYIRNYAEELYKKWLENKHSVISECFTIRYNVMILMGGYGVLYPPKISNAFDYSLLNDTIIKTLNDDGFWGCFIKHQNIPIINIYNLNGLRNNPSFHDLPLAYTTKLWNDKKCTDENVKLYKKVFKI